MNIIEDGILKISKGFSHSVNIRWDIDNSEKITSYIPTNYSMNLIKKLLNKEWGANIFVGSYGTGKSHFSTLIASIMTNRFKKEKYTDLLDKIGSHDLELKSKIEKKLDSKTKKLLIIPNDSIVDVKSAILSGLKETLEKLNLTHIIPYTSFDSINNKVDYWRMNYNDTYIQFLKILESDYSMSRAQFESKINNYDREVFEMFKQIYPRLTSGSVFSPLHSLQIVDLLKNINNEIKKEGYDGITIIFDEFGKYLEENIASLNLKDIQDIAEYTNQEEANSNIILITHRDLSQYARIENKSIVSEWRKVEGRFEKHTFINEEYQIFDLISKVLIKDKKRWPNYRKKNNSKVNEIVYRALSIKLFENTPAVIRSELVNKLYPLTPTTAYALVNISNKFAQNERTIFNFLCSEGDNTLRTIISEDERDFPIINADAVYNFFEDIMKKEDKKSDIYKAWNSGNKAIRGLLKSKNGNEKISILKSLVIIKAIGNFDVLAPDKYSLEVLTNIESSTFDTLLKELVDKRVLVYRKSIDQYDFYEGSYIDIDEEIDKVASRDFDLTSILNEEFSITPVMPKRHNDDSKINRVFDCQYIGIKDINKDLKEDEYYKYRIDGRILFFISDKKTDLEDAKLWAKNQIGKEVTFIGIPKEHLDIPQKLDRYKKIDLLLSDEEFLSQDMLLKEELVLLKQDTRQDIFNEIDNLINNKYDHVDIYRSGCREKIVNRLQLNNKVSEVCDKVYNQSITVNNEMINRNKLSITMKRVIKSVTEKYWLEKTGLEGLEFGKYSAEGTFIRTVLLNTGIAGKDKFKIDTLKEIDKFMKRCIGKEESFETLYKKLKGIPYGVKDGVISSILGIILKDYLGEIYIFKRGKCIDITPNIVLDMVDSPEEYSIIIEEWTKDKREYIEALEREYEDYIDKEKLKENRLQAIFEGIKSKFIGLPRFSRVTRTMPKEVLEIRDIIDKEYSDLRALFFERLTKNGESSYSQAYSDIVKMFSSMESFLDEERLRFESFILKSFNIKSVNDSFEKGIKRYFERIDHIDNKVYQGEEEALIRAFLNSKDSEEIINNICYGIENFEFKDINDEMYKDIKIKIGEFKEGLINGSLDQDGVEVEGDNYIKLDLKDIEISFLGESLLGKLNQDIENFGDSLDKAEKIRVVKNLIKNLI